MSLVITFAESNSLIVPVSLVMVDTCATGYEYRCGHYPSYCREKHLLIVTIIIAAITRTYYKSWFQQYTQTPCSVGGSHERFTQK